jgi:hypothetical protein
MVRVYGEHRGIVVRARAIAAVVFVTLVMIGPAVQAHHDSIEVFTNVTPESAAMSTVWLSTPCETPVAVDYKTFTGAKPADANKEGATYHSGDAGGSREATPNADYRPVNGSLTVTKGTDAHFTVPIIDDPAHEPDEFVKVLLYIRNAVSDPKTGTGTKCVGAGWVESSFAIADNDKAPSVPGSNAAERTGSMGAASSRSGGSPSAIVQDDMAGVRRPGIHVSDVTATGRVTTPFVAGRAARAQNGDTGTLVAVVIATAAIAAAATAALTRRRRIRF